MLSLFPLTILSLSIAAAALALLYAVSRESFAYARPFGIPEFESLMNLSSHGSLHCICEPTDPAEPSNDRRRSCRACGCAIVAHDPARLYEQLTHDDVRRITRNLRRAGIDAGRTHLPATLVSLAELHTSSSLEDRRR
jgi:hypothetical protein